MVRNGGTEVLETRIVKIIKKIRDSRSRPCAQNMLEFVNRGGDFTLDMVNLKGMLHGLMKRNVIYDGGKGELESFYVTAEQEFMTCDGSSDVLCGNTTNNNESTSVSLWVRVVWIWGMLVWIRVNSSRMFLPIF